MPNKRKIRLMSLRPLARIALHLIVVFAMILGGAVAPAVAATAALESIPASVEAAPDAMPCDSMSTMQMGDKAPAHQPQGPCVTHHCDLSACLGVACLVELPVVSRSLPPVDLWIANGNLTIPAGVVDTPLRPPNAWVLSA